MRTEGENTWDRLIQGLREGSEQVTTAFWAEYSPLLHRLAEKHLPAGLRRRVGPEDVVQSACFTFLRRVRGGEFQFNDSGALWGLLSAITLMKVHKQARFHLRQKRGLDHEINGIGIANDSVATREFAATGPSPDEAAAFTDQMEHVLGLLDTEERQLVNLKLEGYTNDEAAQCMGSSERTVRRILKRAQARLTRAFADN